jgi:nucleotide-binding universal stress UspA family protein
MRLILVPVAHRPECRIALDAAFSLAAELGADVSGYHIRRAQREQAIALGPLLPHDDVHAAFAVTDGKARSAARAARALYERVSDKHGFTPAKRPARGQRLRALWHEVGGTPSRVFAIAGPVSDLIVVSRPASRAAARARAVMLGALLHSAKPVLVLPQAAPRTLGRRILIAWNQSADAATAVAAALPLLTRAERVVAVTAGPEDRLGPKAAHLARYLAHWDVKIECTRTRGQNVQRELESAYRDADADLIVMGAYSRNRYRQLVFGGVTEHMLFKTDLPVLMLHR